VTFQEIYALLTSRREVKRFRSDPLPDELITQLIECARAAPSTCNLQPVHYFITQDEEKKKRIRRACLNLKELKDAPVLVAFSADRKVVTHNMEDVLDAEFENDAMTDEEEEKTRLFLKFNFDQGLLGITWLAKLLASPLIRLFTPLPLLPAVHKRYFLAKEAMLPAMNFMIAAEAAGLATCYVDILDEWRVRRILGIPWTHIVPVVIAVGYPDELKPKATKIDFDEVVHRC
jgi:nitroreductase